MGMAEQSGKRSNNADSCARKPLGTTAALSKKKRVASPAGPLSRALEEVTARLIHADVPETTIALVVEALAEPSQTERTSALTEAEYQFALSAGIPAEAFSNEALEANRVYELRSAAQQTVTLPRSLLSSAEVSALIGISTDNVRQYIQRGALYALKQSNQQNAFPKWQFENGAPMPLLKEVIAAIPEECHPLDVESVMTSPEDELGGRPPRDWLVTGGSAQKVVSLLSGLNYL